MPRLEWGSWKCTIWIDTYLLRERCLSRFVPLAHETVILTGLSSPNYPPGHLEGMAPIKTTARISGYIIRSSSAALLLLTAQISLAGSARWLLSPQDSAWENLSNWTAGGPPNGPSDIATFGPSSQTDVNISTSVEVNSIVFASNSDSFTFNISPECPGVGPEAN